MTPERLTYNKELAAIERQIAAARRELHQLLTGADAFDLVITATTVPLSPPAMGHHRMVGDVRLNRDRYQQLEKLKVAAEASEAP